MFFFFKQKTAYEMRISDWSSDVCSSDLAVVARWPGSQLALAHWLGIAEAAQLLGRVFAGGEHGPAHCCQQHDGTVIERVLHRVGRSEERRVGKEGVSTGRSRW